MHPISAAEARYITCAFYATAAPAFVVQHGDFGFGGLMLLAFGLVCIIGINFGRRVRSRLTDKRFLQIHVMALTNNVALMHLYLHFDFYIFAGITIVILSIVWFIKFKGSTAFG